MHVCNTHKNVRSVRAMCVQHESVSTLPVAHTVVATTWVPTLVSTTLLLKKMKQNNSSLHYHLERIPADFLPGSFDLSHQDLVH